MTTTTPAAIPAQPGPAPTRPARPARPGPAPRRAGLSEQAAHTAIDAACRTLHLPTIRARAEESLAAAEREQHTYAGLLAELLLAECDDRDQRRRARRVHDAAFPRPKRLDDFDYSANPNVNPAIISTLATGAWVGSGRPLCLLGDSGTGKSHLLIGLGVAAAEAGHRVRYVLASRLVNELAEADNDRELTRVIARYGRVDLLCLDELGYLQLDRRAAELLFQVLTEREERNAIAIATNEPFSGWTKTFTDPRLCAAIVDRLTFNGHIIETGTISYRLAHTRAQRATA
jgi:DNA replication protein DnaC